MTARSNIKGKFTPYYASMAGEESDAVGFIASPVTTPTTTTIPATTTTAPVTTTTTTAPVTTTTTTIPVTTTTTTAGGSPEDGMNNALWGEPFVKLDNGEDVDTMDYALWGEPFVF